MSVYFLLVRFSLSVLSVSISFRSACGLNIFPAHSLKEVITPCLPSGLNFEISVTRIGSFLCATDMLILFKLPKFPSVFFDFVAQ